MSTILGNSLTKKFGSGDSAVYAIREVSFRIHSGEFVGLMGESGAGKSTLLSIIGAMNAPSSGTLDVEGIDIYSLGKEQRTDFRREFLGFVFQSFHLIPYLTVLENVALPLTTATLSRREKRQKAQDALSWVNLADKRNRLPGEISGGEKERVAIARAIVNDPPILLADEPTGNLDTKTSAEIMGLLEKLNDQGTTIIMVTHSHECSRYARRILHITDGRLYEPN
jgi:putative ABC transport system ATP-binding protein